MRETSVSLGARASLDLIALETWFFEDAFTTLLQAEWFLADLHLHQVFWKICVGGLASVICFQSCLNLSQLGFDAKALSIVKLEIYYFSSIELICKLCNKERHIGAP